MLAEDADSDISQCHVYFSFGSAYIRANPRLKTFDQSFIGTTKMKAKVYVNLKPGVLDPQGKAIQHSVELLGFSGISDIRQGKYFEVALDSSLSEKEAQESVARMAREVLSNPIIEDYRVEIEA
jgi:phosphoribosylformylglycinamidine synthase subunit PurS